MSSYRLLGFSGAILLLVLVGGTLIGGVSASPSTLTGTTTDAPAPGAAGGYCQAYRAALAANLGTTEEALAEASRRAAATTIDLAVADGALTTAVADRLKARLAGSGDDGCLRQ